MSESDELGGAVNRYQAAVWATKEFVPRVSADSENEAESEAADLVKMEQGISDKQIKTVRHESELDDGRHQVQVWASNEYVVEVEAADEEAAELEAEEAAKMMHGLVDSDISSVNVEAEL